MNAKKAIWEVKTIDNKLIIPFHKFKVTLERRQTEIQSAERIILI